MDRRCTREQIREIDRRAIEEYGIPGVVLMENAGRGVAQVAARMLARPADKMVVIFCGRGNNGGDGFVIARHLHNLGAKVRLVTAFPLNEQTAGDAGVNLRIVRKMALPLVVADSIAGQADAAMLAKGADLIVDALLGTGVSGDVREPCLDLIRLINAADKPVLSVDIPSGLDADTGAVLRAAVRAKCTVTFVLPKTGFTKGDAPAHIGNVTVVDIGVPMELLDAVVT